MVRLALVQFDLGARRNFRKGWPFGFRENDTLRAVPSFRGPAGRSLNL